MTLETNHWRDFDGLIYENAPTEPGEKHPRMVDDGVTKYEGADHRYLRCVISTNHNPLDRGNDLVPLSNWVLIDEKGEPRTIPGRVDHDPTVDGLIGRWVDLKIEEDAVYKKLALMGTHIFFNGDSRADKIWENRHMPWGISAGFMPVKKHDPILNLYGQQVGRHFNSALIPIEASFLSDGDDVYARIYKKRMSLPRMIDAQRIYRQGYEAACQDIKQLLAAGGLSVK